MPGKPAIKAAKKKKSHGRKIGLSRLAFILLAIIIALAFIVLGVFSPRLNRTVKDRPVSESNKGPVFRKDGTASIIIPGRDPITLDIEIADEEEERMQGLMYRHQLAEYAGMFFIFDKDEPRSFWMKNTFISLDIIYINSNMEIVSIQKYTQPKSTYSLPSEKPARYILEVNAGFTDKHGIGPGHIIRYSR